MVDAHAYLLGTKFPNFESYDDENNLVSNDNIENNSRLVGKLIKSKLASRQSS